MTDELIVLRGRLNGSQKNKLPRLLNMQYRPSELAEIVGFSKRQIYRVYIPLGLPHEKEKSGHIWINGKSFQGWYLNTFKKVKLGPKEMFCLTCRKPVPSTNPKKRQRGEIKFLVADCPYCGRRLAKIINNRRGKLDKQK